MSPPEGFTSVYIPEADLLEFCNDLRFRAKTPAQFVAYLVYGFLYVQQFGNPDGSIETALESFATSVITAHKESLPRQ